MTKTGDKIWSKRLTQTAASFVTMVRFVDALLPGNRAKLSKEALQEAAHLCQLLVAVQDDLAEQGVAATSLSEKLLAGDRNLEMELRWHWLSAPPLGPRLV